MTASNQEVSATLLWRLFRIFSLCVGFVWTTFLAWAVFTALSDGREAMLDGIETYSRQILPVAVALQDTPATISQIFSNLERLEDELEEDDPDFFFIDVVVDGERVYQGAENFTSPIPQPGFVEFEHEDTIWEAHTSVSEDGRVLARVTFEKISHLNVTLPNQIALFFLPLLVSLPLLLLPAWFMARFGLRPLDELAEQIGDRVASRSLESLPASRYRELNSVVTALNRLLGRMGDQLQRERDLVAEVAHELKTPLAILQTNQGILRHSADEQRKAIALEDIGAGVARGNHLVQQLLGLARLEKELGLHSRKRSADIAEFVRLRLAHAESLASARAVSLDLVAPETLSAVLDVDAFAAVLDNLLDNAIKYSPVGGSVEVVLRRHSPPSELHLQVRDFGQGIPENLRTQAFARFERLAAHRPELVVDGAGLGLTIVQRAIQRLGGKVSLEASGPEGGLTANVTVPLV